MAHNTLSPHFQYNHYKVEMVFHCVQLFFIAWNQVNEWYTTLNCILRITDNEYFESNWCHLGNNNYSKFNKPAV